MPSSQEDYYVRVEHLVTRFFTSRGIVKAIDDVSFGVKRGEIFGLVGESGCGKSVTANSIMDLIPDPPGRILSGSIYIDGFNVLSDLGKLVSIRVKSETNVKIKRYKRYIKRHNFVLSKLRGKKVAMIFQEPFLALNPVLTIGDQIIEAILLHERIDIANAIIRRETFTEQDVRNFVETATAEKARQERRKIVNRWTREYGLAQIEHSVMDLLDNQTDKALIASEIMRMAAEQRTGVNIRRIARARDYYKAQNELLELNLRLLDAEAAAESDVMELRTTLNNLRVEYIKLRSRRRIDRKKGGADEGTQGQIEEMAAKISELRKELSVKRKQVDRSRIKEISRQISKFKRSTGLKFMGFRLQRSFMKRRIEKPFNTEARRRALELLQLVNIAEPSRIIDSYPHELSGGMQQRAMIAMALASEPKMLIADEPTTALDVTTQAQILDLIKDLRRVTESSVLFITHDLAVIAEMCDRVGVMYAGNLVEEAPTSEIFFNPRHPYTQGLLQSIPKMPDNGTRFQKLQSIPGSVPNLIFPPPGCRFHPRCPYKMDICEKEKPRLIEVSQGHRVACWLYPEGGVIK